MTNINQTIAVIPACLLLVVALGARGDRGGKQILRHTTTFRGDQPMGDDHVVYPRGRGLIERINLSYPGKRFRVLQTIYFIV